MQIEKDIPIPTTATKWPFARMEVGDSFSLAKGEVDKARNAACSFQRHHKSVKFSVRKVEEDIWRLWRVS